MKKLKVAVLFGGKSGEHEVSIVSGLSIFKALDKSKYDISLIGIDKEGRWLMPDQTALLAQSANPRLIKLSSAQNMVSMLPYEVSKQMVAVGDSRANVPEKFDVILPILHGTNGEDGTIQGLFELANVAYVGSGVLGSSLGMDKDLAKRVLRDAGIPVVPFITVKRHEYLANKNAILNEAKIKFGFPYFVKPANTGSSVGVHKIKNETDALSKIEDAFQYDSKILIEQGIDARELEVAVLGNHDPKASIIGEIIPKHEFYSYEAKYIDPDGADLKIPAEGLTAQQQDRIRQLAVDTFRVLDCAGLARVDFFMDRGNGKVYLNEVNTIPGFTQISMYPKLWEATGVKYSDLLDKLIALAIERHQEKNAKKTSFQL